MVLYQESEKRRAMEFFGLKWSEVDLPYAEWAAIRERMRIYKRPVRALADAQALFAELHASGKMFHPDDAPHTVVYAARGGRLFTDAEAAALAERMVEIRELDWSAWNDGEHPECPCGYLMQTYPLGE